MEHDLDVARRFLANVVPWPGDGLDGYVNVHFRMEAPSKKTPGEMDTVYPGRACQTIGDAAFNINWMLEKNLDIYFCTSLQSNFVSGLTQNGKPCKKAKRGAEFSVAMRSFFVDVDIGKEGHKGNDNGYVSVQEALRGIAQLTKQTGLPKPTYVVTSGGGLHVYWTMAEAIPPEEWWDYAYKLANAGQKAGLKADYNATVDRARILRIPQTFNHKLSNPRPVTLAIEGNVYSNDRILKCLEPYEGNPKKLVIKPIDPSFIGAAAAVNARYHQVEKESLGAGIEVNNEKKDLDEIAKECPFIHDALATGGKNLSEPLWNLTTLVATFTTGGRDDAHRMACAHPGYRKEETDQKYDDKEKANVGWPQCKTIAVDFPGCAGCKHLSACKSPLNLISLPALQQATPLVPAVTHDLPVGYARDIDGIPMLITEEVDEHGQVKSLHQHIALRSMEEPLLVCNGAGETLHWKSRERMGNGNGGMQEIILPASHVDIKKMKPTLYSQGFYYNRHMAAILEDFLLAWMNKLRATRDLVMPASYGWINTNGATSGFAYANKRFSPLGEKDVAIEETAVTSIFKPTGHFEPWYYAWKLIEGRPDMEAIVAASFASPLMHFLGHNGVTFSVYSDSGAGKSTAVELGLAVWGDPKKGKFKTQDTLNSVLNKIGQLRNLPAYWDEIKTQDQYKTFLTAAFDITLGTEKGRANRNGQAKQGGDWQTVLTVCSNDSLLDYIASHSNMNEAGIVRIFEYEAVKLTPGDPRIIDLTTATQATAALHQNYGHLGMAYARYLGENYGSIKEQVTKVSKQFEEKLKPDQDERFWVHLIAVLLMGAALAKNLNLVSFDTVKLKGFLFDKFEEQRKNRKEVASDIKQASTVEGLLTQFLVAHQKHVLWTDDAPKGPGRPMHGFRATRVTPNLLLNGVKIQMIEKRKIMRINCDAMKDWCNATKKANPQAFVKNVAKTYNAIKMKAQFGVGTEYAVPGRPFVLDIDVSKYPELDVFN